MMFRSNCGAVLMRSSDGLNMRPQPFRCRFAPRSPEIRETINREGRQALENLAVYDGESERVSDFFQRADAKA